MNNPNDRESSATEQTKTPLLQRPWARLWILSEVIAIFAVIAFFIWPQPEPPTTATIRPVTRDSSVRVADRVPTGTVEEFATSMTDVQTVDASIQVDLRYRDANNFTGAPLPGYESNHAFLRREAAIALALVQKDLREANLGLLVFDGYRPVRATEAIVAWSVRKHRENLVTDGYISDRSQHNVGVAIDCTLVDLRSGKPLEMGVPFDTFTDAAQTSNASGVAATNRARLSEAMKKRGFANFSREWWHYSYAAPDSTLRRFDFPIR